MGGWLSLLFDEEESSSIPGYWRKKYKKIGGLLLLIVMVFGEEEKKKSARIWETQVVYISPDFKLSRRWIFFPFSEKVFVNADFFIHFL